jgi:multiple sugar transport system permease protein
MHGQAQTLASEEQVIKNRHRSRSRLQVHEDLTGYAFIAPMLLGLLVFTVIPIFAAIYLSFTDWNFVAGLDKMGYVGFDNFTRLMKDSVFLVSLKNNLILMVVVPVTLAVSLLLSVLINKKVYAKDAFKVIYFIPYISSIIAVSIVFQVLFHPSYGPINQTLMSLGVSDPPKWLADPSFALFCVMGIMIWTGIGYNMIIFIAGLQSIPADLYEAADIDGASKWTQFYRITLPLLSPTTFFLFITGIIASFKVFDVISQLTNGGPADSTTVVVFNIYQTAFQNLQSGYASAMSIALLFCILFVTGIQWIGQKKWVNY